MATVACLIPTPFLLTLIGTGVVSIYMGLCVAAIVGRRTCATAHSAYRMPWYPVPPLLGVAALLLVLYANSQDKAVGRPSLLALVAIIGLTAAYYALVFRRRGQWVLRGPEASTGKQALP